MSRRFLTAAVSALAIAAFAVAPAFATEANTIKPNICETECGGSWGAKEHAKWFAENNHPLYSVGISGCNKNSEHGAQWVCWGQGFHLYTGNPEKFHVWISQYGYEQWWTQP
jgi:hypothetical protein